MKTVHVIVEGRVQGVFFRDYARREARKLALKGWARNRPDGSVEVVVSGNPSQVETMLDWLQTGSPLAVVSSVTVEEILPTEKMGPFEIRY